jgi:hypothetical protein
MDGACSIHERKNHTNFWYIYPKEIGHMEDLGIDGRIIIKLIIKKQDASQWTGFLRLGIETSGWLFKMLDIS